MNDHPSIPPQSAFSRSFGAGPRPVLAIHCSLAHSGAWRGLGSVMAEEATLHAFDMLSHGRSPDWDGAGVFQLRNADLALALLADLDASEAASLDLVGHSFGATVALAVAQRRPELVRSLTLIEPVLFAAAGQIEPKSLVQMREEHLEIRDAYAQGQLEHATRLFNRAWGAGHPKWPDLPEQSRAAMMRSFPAVMDCDKQVYEDEAGLVAEGQLETLSVPVLVVDGSESQPIMQVVTRALMQRLPDGRHVRIAGAGHMAPITHAADVADHLRQFWT
ncbi:alpha/beta hydrolase [Phaeobacter sp.]|uniref:alpha/beta fold hydrolase n=1 Tax=Phaeobacter sp. TaxID=1902409 RepID=UPI0025DC5A7C|nr:alpha/beta hydrolase [Phaeobacter sp.]